MASNSYLGNPVYDFFLDDNVPSFVGDYTYEPILPDNAFDFENGPFSDMPSFGDLIKLDIFGGGSQQQQPSFIDQLAGKIVNSQFGPMGTARQAGQQLAGNLRAGAGEAAAIGQGLGIKGQLIAGGAALLGEDAQLNRETNALLRAQQLNQTNLAREGNAQRFKSSLAGRMNPGAISRYSSMIYGI